MQIWSSVAMRPPLECGALAPLSSTQNESGGKPPHSEGGGMAAALQIS